MVTQAGFSRTRDPGRRAKQLDVTRHPPNKAGHPPPRMPTLIPTGESANYRETKAAAHELYLFAGVVYRHAKLRLPFSVLGKKLKKAGRTILAHLSITIAVVLQQAKNPKYLVPFPDCDWCRGNGFFGYDGHIIEQGCKMMDAVCPLDCRKKQPLKLAATLTKEGNAGVRGATVLVLRIWNHPNASEGPQDW
ncbi:hypothetical protein BDZ91DRAFT_763905 [Kalaharituber pfeilii]|nr:hypothetical protein BDZ91DRAFT_763905 [Kalaharituber pfeilii]